MAKVILMRQVKKRYHSALSVKHALINWSDRDYEGAFVEQDGSLLSPVQARAMLVDLIARGRFFLIMSGDEDDPCDGWSHRHGCPGHPIPDFVQPTDPPDDPTTLGNG